MILSMLDLICGCQLSAFAVVKPPQQNHVINDAKNSLRMILGYGYSAQLNMEEPMVCVAADYTTEFLGIHLASDFVSVPWWLQKVT